VPTTSSQIFRQNSGEVDVVDCDLHIYPPEEDTLTPFLPEQFRGKGISYPDGNWSSPIGRFREGVDLRDASDVVTQHLDPLEIEHGIVTGTEPVLRAGAAPDRRYGAAISRAYNDWLFEEGLSRDKRLLGSIVVAPSEPALAAEEIRRLGDHPDAVQVVMASGTQIALGEERYWPIYEAAVEHDLPVAIHAGAEGYGLANANTGAGYPSTYLEAYSVTPANFMGQLLNLVLEGPFVEFPSLRVVMIGGGYSWVPSFLWRIDKAWKGLTEDMPWVKRPPSEYVREHIRFVTHPVDESGDPEWTEQMLQMLHAEDTLLFGSDYPHWDSYTVDETSPNLDQELVRAIFADTAADLYKL